MPFVRNSDTITYPFVTCQLCGHGEQAYYNDEVRDQMVSRKRCHTCMYWEDRAERLESNAGQKWPNMVVVRTFERGPTCYAIANELPGFMGSGRGYGGSRFIIEFDDGRRMASSNMWSGEAVPLLWQRDSRFAPTACLLGYSDFDQGPTDSIGSGFNAEFERLVEARCILNREGNK